MAYHRVTYLFAFLPLVLCVYQIVPRKARWLVLLIAGYVFLWTFDGRMAFIPNSSISSGKLINYTGTGRRRVELSVSASYGSAPAQVRKAVQAAIKRTEGVLEDPEPRVFLDRYGDSAISYTIWVWARNEDFLSVKIQLNELLYDVFAKYGVEMTYPHLQVHLKDR